MTILEKIKYEEDWLSEVNLTKQNIEIAFAGIRATALESQRWIPVTERLPEEHKWVLCSCRASIYEVLMLTNKGWEDGYDKVYMQGFVVAWMPLPEEPPKAESEEKQEQTGGEADGK